MGEAVGIAVATATGRRERGRGAETGHEPGQGKRVEHGYHGDPWWVNDQPAVVKGC